MAIRLIQKIIQNLRDMLPLSFRQRFGPFVAYCVYIWRIYVTKNRNAPRVLSLGGTVAEINDKELSVIRFGDGEISLMENESLGFQHKSGELAKKLRMIVQANEDGLLICVPGIWGTLDGFVDQSFKFILHHLFRHGHVWQSLLSPNQTYGDAYITRPYLGYKDKSKSGIIFEKLFLNWKGRDVVLIEGEKSRLGVGNDMFGKVQSLQRILCPAENAYSRYKEIKSEALKIPKDKLILISLGPTAKVLAYDLFLAGYRVFDIGHIDMEYEMFLRKETKLVKVEYKYFNEINEKDPKECRDERYLSQVIARIL
jgi:glycosyltransferase family protein